MVPARAVKIGGFVFLLLVGWVFILGSNNRHVTAASVIVCLSYLAILFTVWNLWRTGASAAGPIEEDEGWGRPIGARAELEKEKKTLLKGIKEAEFDAAMGKLSKADADSLIREYRARAIEVIKQIEGLGGTGLSTKDQIAHEVKARIALDLSDKPSNRAKNVVNARAAKADAKSKANGAKAKATESVAAEPADENIEAPKADEPAVVPEISAEAKAKASAEADAIAAKAQATAAADRLALAEAKAAAAKAAAEAAEAKAEAARAMAEVAEARAEAVKAAAETKAGAKAEGERV